MKAYLLTVVLKTIFRYWEFKNWIKLEGYVFQKWLIIFVTQNRILSSPEAQPCSGTLVVVYSETWKGLLMPDWNLVKNLVVADWRLVLAANAFFFCLFLNKHLSLPCFPGKWHNNVMQRCSCLLKCLYFNFKFLQKLFRDSYILDCYWKVFL